MKSTKSKNNENSTGNNTNNKKTEISNKPSAVDKKPGKENLTSLDTKEEAAIEPQRMLITHQKSQTRHHKDFINKQCKHSDGYDGSLHTTETGVGTIAVNTVPTKSSHKPSTGIPKNQSTAKKSNNKVQSKGNSTSSKKPRQTKSVINEVESHTRYAMEFPRHNWLLERLVSENKIDGQDVKQQERKLKEKMDQERDRKEKENLELERLNKERRKILRLERTKQKEHHQQPNLQQQQQQQQQQPQQLLWLLQQPTLQQYQQQPQHQQHHQHQQREIVQDLTSKSCNTSKLVRARSDSEIEINSPNEAKQNLLKRSLSFDGLSNDNLNIKIMNVVSLSCHKTEQDLTTAIVNPDDTLMETEHPIVKTLGESSDTMHEPNEIHFLQEISRKMSSATDEEEILDTTPDEVILDITHEKVAAPSPTNEELESLEMKSSNPPLTTSAGNNKHATIFKPKIIHHQTETERDDLCSSGATAEKNNAFLVRQKSAKPTDPPQSDSVGTIEDVEENTKDEIVDVLSIDDETPSAFKKSFKTASIRDNDAAEDESNQTDDLDDGNESSQQFFEHLTRDPKSILFENRESTASSNNENQRSFVHLHHPKPVPSFVRDSSATLDSSVGNRDRSFEYIHPKPTPFERISPPEFPTRPSVLNSASFTYQKRFTVRASVGTEQSAQRLPTYMQTTHQSMPSSAMYKNKLRFADSIMESFIHDRRRKYSVDQQQRAAAAGGRRPTGTAGSYRQHPSSSLYYAQQQGSVSPLRNERMNPEQHYSVQSPTKNSFLMELQQKHDEGYSSAQVNKIYHIINTSISIILYLSFIKRVTAYKKNLLIFM